MENVLRLVLVIAQRLHSVIIMFETRAERVQCHSWRTSEISCIILQPLQIRHRTLCFLRWDVRGALAGSGQGVEAGAARRVPFHCSWLRILLPQVRRNVHVLVFWGTLGFIAPRTPFLSLLVMQRGNKCFHYPQERDLVGGSWRRRVKQTDQQESEQQRARGEGQRHRSCNNTDR